MSNLQTKKSKKMNKSKAQAMKEAPKISLLFNSQQATLQLNKYQNDVAHVPLKRARKQLESDESFSSISSFSDLDGKKPSNKR